MSIIILILSLSLLYEKFNDCVFVCVSLYSCLCGSLPQWAWPFLVKKGVSTLDCVPYTSGSGHVEKCPSTCADGSALRMYHAANYTHAGNFLDASKHIDAIMREVMRGPVDVTFNVFSDFKEFDFSTGGVYKHQNGTYEGLHSVEIVGWGAHATTNTPYWLVRSPAYINIIHTTLKRTKKQKQKQNRSRIRGVPPLATQATSESFVAKTTVALSRLPTLATLFSPSRNLKIEKTGVLSVFRLRSFIRQ